MLQWLLIFLKVRVHATWSLLMTAFSSLPAPSISPHTLLWLLLHRWWLPLQWLFFMPRLWVFVYKRPPPLLHSVLWPNVTFYESIESCSPSPSPCPLILPLSLHLLFFHKCLSPSNSNLLFCLLTFYVDILLTVFLLPGC